MDIFFHIDKPFVADIEQKLLQKVVLTTCQLVDNCTPAPDTAITITITDNQTVQQLNHQYRGLNKPTDVLSFQNIPDPDFPDVDPTLNDHLGDIVIAYPIAQAQANNSKHALLDEIILLTVHGMLHLLEFDHDTSKHKEKMWATQHQIMTNLGLAHVQPTET